MKNGKLKTWQVVKWLSKHPTHTAEAPETTMKYPTRVRNGAKYLVFEICLNGVWNSDSTPYQRSDWTIRNERGRKVRFKPRAKLEHVSPLRSGERLSIDNFEIWCRYGADYEVFVRKASL